MYPIQCLAFPSVTCEGMGGCDRRPLVTGDLVLFRLGIQGLGH